MNFYQSKLKAIGGSDYGEVHQVALQAYKKIAKRTKRRTYIRAAYFKKDKVFLGIFWDHLLQKNWRDRTRRLKFYICALDLIQNTRSKPETKDNPNNFKEIVHRFAGKTKEKELFYVQIKERKKDSEKSFVSVFPYNLG
jgi:acyl carrier protein phosphodiesterase